MYLSPLLPALLFSFAGATYSTTTATTTTACAAEPVLDACLASTEAIVQGCLSTDYQCLCQKWSDVLVCFNQCPDDSRQASVLSSKQTYCNDAAVYGTTTSSASYVSASTTAASGTASGSGSSSSTGTSGGVRAATTTATSGTATSTGNSKSGAKRELAVGVGGAIIGVAGLLGAFL